MKKLILILFVSFFVFEAAVSQVSWCGNSYIIVNGLWYTARNSHVHDGGYFEGADLGTFSELNFRLGGELQVYKPTQDDAKLYYRIDDATEWSVLLLPFKELSGNNSKHYANKAVPITGLEEGAHTIEVYFECDGIRESTDPTYKATFHVRKCATDIRNRQIPK